MKKNNKGLSTIVATLLIILLVLVATGVVWVVVRGVVQGGSEDIEISAACLDVQVEATKVTPIAYGAAGGNNTLNVTIRRSGGDVEIGNVKQVLLVDLLFTDNDESDSVPPIDNFGAINNLQTATRLVSVPVSALANATKVTVAPYFLKAGNKKYCGSTNPLQFVPK